MKKVDSSLIEEVLQRARQSERKRTIHVLNAPDERLQRMINACLHDTYVTPHMHENPGKLEIFSVLRGRLSVLFFDDRGDVSESTILDEKGPVNLVEVPPGTWHSIVILSPEAVVYEIKEGPYDPDTDKKFAPWAPAEGTEGVEEYLDELRKKVKTNSSH